MADIEKRRRVPREERKRSGWQDQPKEPKITSRHGAHSGNGSEGLHKALEGGLYEAIGSGSQSDQGESTREEDEEEGWMRVLHGIRESPTNQS